MTGRCAWRLVALFALSIVTVGPASAQGPEARLGGGSDIAGGTVVELPQGVRVPPIHFVFADNPEDRPIEVEFRAESPRGIEVQAERTRFTIPPGGDTRARFAIAVGEQVAAGDYPVSAQLVRADITPATGGVTNVPAVGTRFTVRVVGGAANLVVKAEDRATKKPVEGTLVLSAIVESGALFELNRGIGSSLMTRVAPGRYEAAFLLDDRKLASKRIEVKADESADVILTVEAVSFVVVAASPVTEGGRVILADLVASLQNQLAAISGPILIQVHVRFGSREIGRVVLRELDSLPVGLTDAKSSYRPDTGWKPGTYFFDFELVTPEFSLKAAETQRIDVAGPRSIRSLATAAAIAILAAGYLAFRRWRMR